MKTKAENVEVGVIVARFQSPILHEGHQEIIEKVRSNHARVIIFLGLSPLRCTRLNPYDFSIRKAMIEEKYKDLEVLYIDDVGDNEVWSKNLDRQIYKAIGPNQKAVLYGSRDSFINAYKGHFPTIELVPTKMISASEIRRRIGIKPKHEQSFREGIIYSVENQYPTVHPTVDMAIIKFNNPVEGEKELLLARKPTQNLLRFPGGFLDPLKDKSAEGAAVRETLEETGLTTKVVSYIGSALVDDWRYRHEQNKIMTFLYAMEYQGGTPVASDDIEYVIWRKFGEIKENEIVESHRPLIRMLNDFFNNRVLRLT